MIRDPQILEDFLLGNPQAWPVRMALIEELVRDGDLEKARRLIRESPLESPMPEGFRFRIHTALTQGAEGIKGLAPLLGFEDRPAVAIASPIAMAPRLEEEKLLSPQLGEPSLEELAETDQKKRRKEPRTSNRPVSSIGRQFEEPSFNYQKPESRLSESGALVFDSLSSGSRALAELQPIRRKKPDFPPPPPPIDQAIAAIKWENYSGKLNLSEGVLPPSVEPPSSAPERFSALTLALVLHAVVAFLVSLVVFNIARPNPPQLVATLPEEYESDELVIKRINRPMEIDPAAAAAQAVSVETALTISDFNLPEVEIKNQFDVTALFDGTLENGIGMTLSPDIKIQSQVNFFGISGGGDKIVFIVDATRPMLVDEKGGMFAYNKVKNEIGAMLGGLSRGTKFNILLYDGSLVQAFREELVPGLPSNVRLAMEWLAPLNRDYEDLGLPRHYGEDIEATDLPGLPIAARDVAHYTKCIQKAMEWQAAAIFCIAGGYEDMRRSPTPEMLKKMREENPMSFEPPQPDPADKARYERDLAKWQGALDKTRQWLDNENLARREKGISPKVVLNFYDLVREVTGETPPQPQARIGGNQGNLAGRNLPRLPPVTPEDIGNQFKRLVSEYYLKQNKAEPSVHMVIFLGEDEDFQDADRDHFRDITKKNRGKLKILRGLAELKDVTR